MFDKSNKFLSFTAHSLNKNYVLNYSLYNTTDKTDQYNLQDRWNKNSTGVKNSEAAFRNYMWKYIGQDPRKWTYLLCHLIWVFLGWCSALQLVGQFIEKSLPAV